MTEGSSNVACCFIKMKPKQFYRLTQTPEVASHRVGHLKVYTTEKWRRVRNGFMVVSHKVCYEKLPCGILPGLGPDLQLCACEALHKVATVQHREASLQ